MRKQRKGFNSTAGLHLFYITAGSSFSFAQVHTSYHSAIGPGLASKIVKISQIFKYVQFENSMPQFPG